MMIYVAAGLVVAALVAMASGRVDPLLALLVALILAGILGIAPADQLAAGLSNAGVITVAAMLVIAKGIVQTGVVSRATWALLASTSTAQQVFRRLSFPIGVASALINTTPLVALLIPAARQLDQTKRIPTREVLLPLAHVTTLAGSLTLIGKIVTAESSRRASPARRNRRGDHGGLKAGRRRPAFASMRQVLGDDVFLKLYPQWRTEQKRATRGMVGARETAGISGSRCRS